VYTCICTYIHAYINAHVNTCIYTYIHIYIYIYVYIYEYTYVHIYMHTCMNVYTYMYTHTHLYIHTYKQNFIHACTTCTHVYLSMELLKNRLFCRTPTANSIILLSGLIVCCTFSIPLNIVLLGLSRAHTRAYALILTPALALSRSHEDSFLARARVHALSLSNNHTH